jgi:hypothetical protein
MVLAVEAITVKVAVPVAPPEVAVKVDVPRVFA